MARGDSDPCYCLEEICRELCKPICGILGLVILSSFLLILLHGVGLVSLQLPPPSTPVPAVTPVPAPVNRKLRLEAALRDWNHLDDLPLPKDRLETYVSDLFTLHRGKECLATLSQYYIKVMCDGAVEMRNAKHGSPSLYLAGKQLLQR